jgi:hypothetical protein
VSDVPTPYETLNDFESASPDQQLAQPLSRSTHQFNGVSFLLDTCQALTTQTDPPALPWSIPPTFPWPQPSIRRANAADIAFIQSFQASSHTPSAQSSKGEIRNLLESGFTLPVGVYMDAKKEVSNKTGLWSEDEAYVVKAVSWKYDETYPPVLGYSAPNNQELYGPLVFRQALERDNRKWHELAPLILSALPTVRSRKQLFEYATKWAEIKRMSFLTRCANQVLTRSDDYPSYRTS